MITGWKKYLNYTFPVPTDADRARLELYIGHTLPDVYWETIREHQGDIPVPDRVVLENGVRERCGVFLNVFDPTTLPGPDPTGAADYSVITEYGSMANFYPREIVPFSDDTGGNYMAFDFRAGKEPRIVFVDHNVTGENGLTFVAQNFNAFLAMLVPKLG